MTRASGFVVWLTGLPAAGKTALAYAMQEQLQACGVHTVVLDSDDLRAVLTPEPVYTAAERDWFYGVIVYLAAWLARSGVNVLIAATANRAVYRKRARRQIARFAEVHVQCALDVCRRRDPKGIYALAESGDADHVPGLGVAYEPPVNPEAVVDTTVRLPAEAACAALIQLELEQFIRGTDYASSPTPPTRSALQNV